MKSFLVATVLISASVTAQDTWTETFKIPQGITYRARMAGFDCGVFGNKYVSAPSDFLEHKIQYKQLAADKDLNIFLIEASFPNAAGEACTYGVYLDRNRDEKSLDFNHSEVLGENCEAGKAFLDMRMSKVSYEGSKRGLRYIAAQVITEETNDVCESGNVRAVFDRRF